MHQKFLAALLATSLAACGGSTAERVATATAPAAATEDAATISAEPDGVPRAADEVTPAESILAMEAELGYPRRLDYEGGYILVHAPQIHSWQDFEIAEGVSAAEAHPDDGPTVFASVDFRARAVPDVDRRIVTVSEHEVTGITFADGRPADVEHYETLQNAIPKVTREVPLDLALYTLDEGILETDTQGLATDPPRIDVARAPARLVLLQGEAVLAPIQDSPLQFVANTNWPLFHATDDRWLLLDAEGWLTAPSLDGDWSWATSLHDGLAALPDDGNWSRVRAAATAFAGPPQAPAPTVMVRTEPTELVVVDGEPVFEAIGESDLTWLSNSDSPVFRLEDRWYLLAAGRWFAADGEYGPWTLAAELPDAFRSIPDDHPRADVLAAVPGTPEARVAAMEAQLPRRTEVAIGTEPGVAVSYSGTPEFEDIPGTSVARALNTPFDVIRVGTRYYLCYEGIWYVADSAVGPWAVATEVPDEIYGIPPSSPAYHTTYARVYDSTPDTVVYYTTSGYDGMYVSRGVVVWGTGYYYPPYVYYDPFHPWSPYYPIYYPYPYSYGGGSWYNPRTGAYGSYSRWYGPYGGYGYGSSYDPRTGRYLSAEAAWDNDEWALNARGHNPRTGRSFETRRYYDADDNAWKIDTSIDGRLGGAEIARRYDDGVALTRVDTRSGGAAEFRREADGRGGSTGSGAIATRDGRRIATESEFRAGEGEVRLRGSEGGSGTITRDVARDGTVTREGSFEFGGRTIETETVRDGSGPRTTFETSEGARGTIVGRGTNRTAIGQSPTGDLYAGRDGQVYRRTDDGWARRDSGAWRPIENPLAGQDRRRAADDRLRNIERNRLQQRQRAYGNLDRNYRARQQGMQRYGQRAGQFRNRARAGGFRGRAGGMRARGIRRR